MPEITAFDLGAPSNTDILVGVDTQDTTMSPEGTTKKYNQVDLTNFYLQLLGLLVVQPVVVATTGALTVTYDNGTSGIGATLTNAGGLGALVIDDITLAVNDRVLVKNQVFASQNGIYTVTDSGSDLTNWVLTRATDFDEPSQIIQFQVLIVLFGSVNNNTLYQFTTFGSITIGSTPLTFYLFDLNAITVPPIDSDDQYLLSRTGQKPIWSDTLGNALADSMQFTDNAFGGILGTATDDDAPPGYVGEIISSQVVAASSIALTNNVAANITSINLTAGDWDVWGNFSIAFSALGTSASGWVSPFSASIPDLSLISQCNITPAAIANYRVAVPGVRGSFTSTTTVYLSTIAAFASGTASACGGIYARRRR